MRRAVLLALALLATPAAAEPLHEAVEAYVLYQGDVTALLDQPAPDAASIDAALALALRHDPDRVAQGWLAYGALTASQSPAFVAGVRSRVRAAGRAPVIRQLNRDISYARRRPPGSAEAIQLILAAAAADSARLRAGAVRYSGIGDAFSPTLSDTTHRDARSTALRALAAETRTLDADLAARVHPGVLAATPLSDANAFGGPRFWDALAARQSAPPSAHAWREASAPSARVNRMLTLAGLYVVAATDSESRRVRDMLSDAPLAECLAIEQLQLRQCASVSSAPNEDAHCLARHSLAQPAACFSGIVAAP